MQVAVVSLPEHDGTLIELGSKTIRDLLVEDGNYTQFVAIFDSLTFEQQTTILGDGLVTVFAPNDDVFSGLTAEESMTLNGLSETEKVGLVSRHFARGLWMAFEANTVIPSADHLFLQVEINDASVSINGVGVEADEDLGRATDGYAFGLSGLLWDGTSTLATGTCAQPSAVDEAGYASGFATGVSGSVTRFTATESGIYCVDTVGSTFNTTLAVFSDCLDAASLTGENDDPAVTLNTTAGPQTFTHSGFTEARLVTDLAEGESIDIRVRGTSSLGVFSSGDYSLRVSPGPCDDISLYDILRRSGEAEFFLDALWYAAPDQLQLLMGTPADGTTVFAPTDDSFRELTADDANAVAELWADPEALGTILRYHFVDGVRATADFSGPVTTAAGETLNLSLTAGQAQANGERIVSGDLAGSNGLAHAIEGLLYIPEGCVADAECTDGLECIEGACQQRAPETLWARIQRLERFSILEMLILETEFADLLDHPNPFSQLERDVTAEECENRVPACGLTLFAPNNSAFDAIDVNMVMMDPELSYRVLHHMLLGLYLADDLGADQPVDSAMGRPINFQDDITGFRIEGSFPVETDIVAANAAVMHEVGVFLPLPALPDACEAATVLNDYGTVSGESTGLQSVYLGNCGGSGLETVFEVTASDYARVCFRTEAASRRVTRLSTFGRELAEMPTQKSHVMMIVLTSAVRILKRASALN